MIEDEEKKYEKHIERCSELLRMQLAAAYIGQAQTGFPSQI
jgi:hypothetical protein